MSAKAFFGHLRRRNRANAARIDALLARRCLREMTVLVGDSSGFTRRTQEHGILQYLSVLTRCVDLVQPIIRRHRGIDIPQHADNLMVLFHDPDHAVSAAIDIHRHLLRRNRTVPPEEQFHFCFGAHHGSIYAMAGDAYGDTVNLASKIGEDLADKDEILVTGETAGRLSKRFRTHYARSTRLGGREVELHRVLY